MAAGISHLIPEGWHVNSPERKLREKDMIFARVDFHLFFEKLH